jgi:hypothetical protein
LLQDGVVHVVHPDLAGAFVHHCFHRPAPFLA